VAANVINGQRVEAVIDELFGSARNEIERSILAGKYPGWFSMNTIHNNHQNMINFATYRYTVMFDSLTNKFGFPNEFFEVQIIGREAMLGSMPATHSRYFAHLTVPIRPILQDGEEFSHWLVNGRRVNGEEIFVRAANGTGSRRLVRVEMVLA